MPRVVRTAFPDDTSGSPGFTRRGRGGNRRPVTCTRHKTIALSEQEWAALHELAGRWRITPSDFLKRLLLEQIVKAGMA